MDELLEQSILFIGGKGGVGKSTTASALAVMFARMGMKTLIISTDPAHNLGDIFHQEVNGYKTPLLKNLWGIEIDPDAETRLYINGVKGNLKGMVKSNMVNEVHRQIDMAASAPGAEEAALFDRIVSIILEEDNDFDKIIFDTAPTGHTIRLLSLPELMGVWMDGMLERRKKTNKNYSQLLNDGEPVEDPIYDILQKRREKFSKVRGVMLDRKKTGFIFVLIPERLPILETEKAIELMSGHSLSIGGLVINKILPKQADGDFLQKRRDQEKVYLHLMQEKFTEQALYRVPLLEEDICSLSHLEKFADYLQKAIFEGEEVYE
ncbi:arsenic-transporting ATPase [Bacillus sp. AFS015802]|uniref:ArsA family ATPase n=1 Tax=Bacillus sp. AFS015802 TaxID=2033486 RepID=UPI000BF81260|nr:ArsA family ATPase [Bacillus sp. AFS015802]PFA62137.1 arsenic-transporting ATPase [Bacillus sp. AFS015802]